MRPITTSLGYETGSVRLSRYVLELLGHPEYVTILINDSNIQLAFLPSAKPDKAALKITYPKSEHSDRGAVIYSMILVRKIFQIMGWEKDKRYQIPGYYFEDIKVVNFDLRRGHKVTRRRYLKMEEND